MLYVRLLGFGLGDDCRRRARQAADYVLVIYRPIAALVASPLQRTRESAEPFEELFGIEPFIDERVIEPTNVFEGRRLQRVFYNPLNWRHLTRPALPSWGAPNEPILARVRGAMDHAWDTRPRGHRRAVSHHP